MKYPRITWDENIFPDIQPDDVNEFKEYMQRQPFIPWPEPHGPSISFDKWKEIMDKRHSTIINDDPTRIKPKQIANLNPHEGTLWVKVFKEWLKDEEDETEI